MLNRKSVTSVTEVETRCNLFYLDRLLISFHKPSNLLTFGVCVCPVNFWGSISSKSCSFVPTFHPFKPIFCVFLVLIFKVLENFGTSKCFCFFFQKKAWRKQSKAWTLVRKQQFFFCFLNAWQTKQDVMFVWAQESVWEGTWQCF